MPKKTQFHKDLDRDLKDPKFKKLYEKEKAKLERKLGPKTMKPVKAYMFASPAGRLCVNCGLVEPNSDPAFWGHATFRIVPVLISEVAKDRKKN